MSQHDAPAVAERMPLLFRRLILVGTLCALAGVLAGQFMMGPQMLSVAGIAVLFTGLTYNGTGGRKLLWICAGAGSAWTVATLISGWLLLDALDSAIVSGRSLDVPGAGLFVLVAGAAAFTLMVVTAIVAAGGRSRVRRESVPPPVPAGTSSSSAA
ncbi:ATP/GTP-binding protein [Crystallibacter degradans]|uniref:ATP/GTP-binding protein n=1 Tax=Crystallibacter degradans TaxID=2726743 RepID=UPI001474D05E|nr:ATP/GTP-binding protein [Arthrobacter sp. SF27]NMR31185.1 ATP/GTP-binding protein [Arthrobacter sp. SF27]